MHQTQSKDQAQMSDLPEPLTPPDCDLRDFAFMPLDVARLRDSDLAALESPEACWAAVLLWCASWHQVPAASLPDDDRVLSKIAGYGRVLKEWTVVREAALRGWIKCADARLYHPVVAEKAVESWKAKVVHHWKKECDRIRKSNKQREQEGKPALLFPAEPSFNAPEIQRKAPTIPAESNSIPSEVKQDSDGIGSSSSGNPTENPLKGEGQGEGQGEGELTSKAESLSASTVGNSATPPPKQSPPLERPTPKREGQIAILLRNAGVKPFTSMHPLALSWAANSAITDAILEGAVDMARQAKGEGVDISPNYLKPIVEQLLTAPVETTPKSRPGDDWAWKKSDGGIDRKGKELGMFARGGESYRDYAERISTEIEKRKRGGKAA
jgi:hypothetical protein